ncbi:hypothetical protein J6590_011708 [Homalodisca vitripennis]|nr:hypothetical protein J6590_011708 [Homalodisca vitripennis]
MSFGYESAIKSVQVRGESCRNLLLINKTDERLSRRPHPRVDQWGPASPGRYSSLPPPPTTRLICIINCVIAQPRVRRHLGWGNGGLGTADWNGGTERTGNNYFRVYVF